MVEWNRKVLALMATASDVCEARSWQLVSASLVWTSRDGVGLKWKKSASEDTMESFRCRLSPDEREADAIASVSLMMVCCF
jgi:hypothetical protein